MSYNLQGDFGRLPLNRAAHLAPSPEASREKEGGEVCDGLT